MNWFTDYLVPQGLTLVADTLLRSTVLLGVGFTLTLTVRRQPALRHRIGALSLAGLLLLPLLSPLALPWQVSLLAPVVTAAQVPQPQTSSSTGVPSPSVASASPSSGATVASKTSADSVSQSSTPQVPPSQVDAPPVAASQPSTLWLQRAPQWGLALWLLGAIYVLVRSLMSFGAVRRLYRESQRVDDGPLSEQCAQLARELGLTRPVTLRLAHHESVAVPMTWGWRAPVVLLPGAALTWADEQRRSALLHELSHIKRGDWAAQCLATLVCALYWFHPLVWLAAARLRADAERATDEQVVACGVKASDYCVHLLNLARATAASPTPTHLHYGVPMTRTSSIERRLRPLLDESRSRRGFRVPVCVATGALGLAFATAASLQFAARALPSSALSAAPANAQVTTSNPKSSHVVTSSYTATVPGGGRVSLLGVSDASSHNRTWWTPAGQPLPDKSFVLMYSKKPRAGDKTRQFVAKLRDLPKDASWSWRPSTNGGHREGPEGYGNGLVADTYRTYLQGLSIPIPKSQSRVTLDLRISLKPWRTLAETPRGIALSRVVEGYRVSIPSYAQPDPGDSPLIKQGGTLNMDGQAVAGGKAQVGISFPTKDRNTTVLTISHTIADQDVRLVAVDTRGKEHSPLMSYIILGDGAGNTKPLQVMGDGSSNLQPRRLMALFKDLPLSQIRAFRVQVQPVCTVTFPNVRLAPLAATASQPGAAPQAQNPTPVVWNAVASGVRLGISAQSGLVGPHESLVVLYLDVSGGGKVSATDWNKLVVSLAGYPRPINGTQVDFRAVNIAGWRPSSQKGVYTALVRYMRVRPAGHYTVSASLPLHVSGAEISATTPLCHIEMR